MPISPFDIAIILISSVACMYCIVLSRRLKALQNTRNGLGATIKALSDSISAVSSTTDEARFHAGENAARLVRLIEEAKLSCARIEDTTVRLRDAHTAAERFLSQTPPPMPAAAPVAAPPPVAAAPVASEEPSQQKFQEISELMDRLKDLTEASVAAAEQTGPELRPLPTQLRSRMKVV
ncbi:MAG: hypothetical protein HRT81_04360 [Henriciella sp.]|nr:hypothetical protein [Henriciella sp.]